MIDPVGQSWSHSTSCSPQQEIWTACFHDPTPTSSLVSCGSVLGVADFHQVIQGPRLIICMALPSSRFLKISPFSWQILRERFLWVSPGLCSHYLCSDYIGQDADPWLHLTAGRLENTDQLHTPKTFFTRQMRDRAKSPVSGLDYWIDGGATCWDGKHWLQRKRSYLVASYTFRSGAQG